MKICIPTETKEGAKAKIYGHFGSAPIFTLCDTETLACQFIDNSDLQHEHGMCHPLKAIGGAKPDAVAVRGIGMGAIRGLNAAGIKVYITDAETVENAATALRNGTLKEATAENACAHHGGHSCHH